MAGDRARRRPGGVGASTPDDHRAARHVAQIEAQPRWLVERVRAVVDHRAMPHVLWGDVLGRRPEQLGGDLAPLGNPRFELLRMPLLGACHGPLDQPPLPALRSGDAHPSDRAAVRAAHIAADDGVGPARRTGAAGTCPAAAGGEDHEEQGGYAGSAAARSRRGRRPCVPQGAGRGTARGRRGLHEHRLRPRRRAGAPAAHRLAAPARLRADGRAPHPPRPLTAWSMSSETESSPTSCIARMPAASAAVTCRVAARPSTSECSTTSRRVVATAPCWWRCADGCRRGWWWPPISPSAPRPHPR